MSSIRIWLASIALGVLAPAVANASYILDTGVPTSTSAPVIVTTNQSFAAEFTLAANETISQLSAYLTAGSDQPGALFEFSIYSNAAGFVGARPLPSPVFTTAATFAANGWNSEAVNWTPTTAGNYWLVVGAASSGTAPGLDLPLETSASTGTAPALAFAYASGANARYTSSNAPAFGVEISGVSATPLPGTLFLFLTGVLGLILMARRNVTRHELHQLHARCNFSTEPQRYSAT